MYILSSSSKVDRDHRQNQTSLSKSIPLNLRTRLRRGLMMGRMFDRNEPKGYAVSRMVFVTGSVQLTVPVDPKLYNGSTSKLFLGHFDGELYVLPEINGADVIYLDETLSEGFYDGAKEKIRISLSW